MQVLLWHGPFQSRGSSGYLQDASALREKQPLCSDRWARVHMIDRRHRDAYTLVLRPPGCKVEISGRDRCRAVTPATCKSWHLAAQDANLTIHRRALAQPRPTTPKYVTPDEAADEYLHQPDQYMTHSGKYRVKISVIPGK